MLDIISIIKKQKKFFATGITKDINYRIKQLGRLKSSIINNEAEIINAAKEDLNAPSYESYVGSIMMLTYEIKYITKNLKSWATARKAKTPMLLFKSRSYIQYEPYGLTLIIGAWNAPFIVTLLPLIGVLAAGNCAIIKPSELSKAASKVITKIIREAFEEEYAAVVEGGVPETTVLLNERFDFIIYTGNTNVGKIVAEAASKNLTPVVLELGGKSPCVVDRDIDIEITSRRIVWAKYINAGQICTAPDYLVVHKDIKDKLLGAICRQIKNFYGDSPKVSPDYCRIVNERHFDRLTELLNEGNILIGGKTNKNDLYIEPTVIENIRWTDRIMEDEIFGPILPVIEYDDLDAVISKINEKEKPLALYIYTKNKKIARKVLNETSSGGACVNVSIMHFINQYLPFGGIGNSGMGNYHGKASFETFSHKKSILDKSVAVDIKMIYPPYKNKMKLMKMFF